MKKVLIVDDDIISIDLLKIYLKNFNIFDPLCSNNGEEAIKLFKDNEDIDFILLDIRMPVIDGYDVASEILKIKYVPIIVISSQSMIGCVEESRSHGCLDHISKPCSNKHLENILRKHKLI